MAAVVATAGAGSEEVTADSGAGTLAGAASAATWGGSVGRGRLRRPHGGLRWRSHGRLRRRPHGRLWRRGDAWRFRGAPHGWRRIRWSSDGYGRHGWCPDGYGWYGRCPVGRHGRRPHGYGGHGWRANGC